MSSIKPPCHPALPPQAQLVVLSTQIAWSENIESALTTVAAGGDMSPMHSVQQNVEATLNVLADTVLMEQPPLRRRKLEHLVRQARSLSLSISRVRALSLGLGLHLSISRVRALSLELGLSLVRARSLSL